ncbi:hypothetical protein [Paenibacillus spongiae]|uniref:VCBS repeat-containing protein n=1 Tax=Paenibacillus spongiae TaxID=2909671 RepID=A0ABY5SA20_9BACL|nr:hypothetical protein [Paenibacillus spongiae]UVI30801.1 hypothetical protein L1F29_02680 [Paenibacillus spongiae]
MRNRKIGIPLILCGIMAAVVISLALMSESLTASTIHIVNKGTDRDGKARWIEVYDSNNQKKEQAFRIKVEDKAAWSLLEVGSEYFAAYGRRGYGRTYTLQNAQPDAASEAMAGREDTDSEAEAGLAPAAGLLSVKSPMTVSNTPIPGSNSTLKLRLVEGSYYEDWQPGAYRGTVYEGAFVFEVQDEVGNVIETTELSRFYDGPLTFTRLFPLAMADYNGDGLPDFTLGQHSNSSGNEYRIFSVQQNFSIAELPVPGSGLYVSGGEGDKYSIKLKPDGDGLLRYSFYSQDEGKYVHKALSWKDGAFVEVK